MSFIFIIVIALYLRMKVNQNIKNNNTDNTMNKLLIAILILLFSNFSYAGMCACNEERCPPIEVKFTESESVFLAEIKSVKPKKSEKNSIRPTHKIKFKVKETFKGAPSKTEVAYTRHAPLDGDTSMSFDIKIDVGTKYIIFKRPDKDLNLSLCPTYYEHLTDEILSYLRNKSDSFEE